MHLEYILSNLIIHSLDHSSIITYDYGCRTIISNYDILKSNGLKTKQPFKTVTQNTQQVGNCFACVQTVSAGLVISKQLYN